MQLSQTEARVLGALIEKEIATPEYYPLSLNALLAACNQKSSREPVMTLSEEDVRGALRTLEDLDLVAIDHGSRVQRYEHRARTVFHLRRDETAILCLLLLRGPQTPGELRGRADRLHVFDEVGAVTSALARMAAPAEHRPLAIVTLLPKQPGTKEQRYAHLLGDPALVSAAPAGSPAHVDASNAEGLEERFALLEREVAALQGAVELLQKRLAES
ncbi:MAG: YceH family protein [Janthinobacterium lividum]